jgi:hypothetical protein
MEEYVLYQTQGTAVPTTAESAAKATDAAAGATDTGVAMLAVRDDTLTTLTPADGDYARIRVNATGALHVTDANAGVDGANVYVDDADWTATTSSHNLIGGIYSQRPAR